MKIEITKITVLISKNKADELLLHTNLPEGCYPYKGNAHLKITIAKGIAEKYIEDNLNGVEFELIEV